MIALGDDNVPNGFDHAMRLTPAHWECTFTSTESQSLPALNQRRLTGYNIKLIYDESSNYSLKLS